jgi:hypothetical protein
MGRFLRARNALIAELGYSRKLATLAYRLSMGIDTWELIEAMEVGRFGRELLSATEVMLLLVNHKAINLIIERCRND